MNCTIPQTLLEKVRRAMRLEETEFEEYVESLEAEALAYIGSLLYTDVDKIDDEIKKIMIGFYLQYALYSKLEKDEISQDKLDFLNSYITGFNDKTERVNKTNGTQRGVKFI
ncbi:MAG: hypothetical protein CR959_00315 [Fusobacteriales bacterium]|nr:MAG: hypothetical protein CR959_00315 [Fusobacteriales bacterium]